MNLYHWKTKAKYLKREVHALSLAVRDRRAPWYAKALGIFIIGYALSPIDLIPDFIPILGYVDDLILIPLGIIVVVRMIPPGVMDECRERASLDHGKKRKGKHLLAAFIVVLIWLFFMYLLVKLTLPIFLK